MYKFNDNKRNVDFILVYEPTTDDFIKIYRKIYLNNLVIAGLEYEENISEHYYKIFMPKQILYKYCDALQIKLPIKDGLMDKYKNRRARLNSLDNISSQHLNLDKDNTKYKPTMQFLTGRLELFDVDKEDFFLPSLRIMMVHIALNRIKFSDDDEDTGIDHLIEEHVFKTAFPLHDALLADINSNSERHHLLNNWASYNNIHKPQPIKLIKDYFGAKIGLYFLWLGFYTYMLVPASIIGILSFFYGIVTLHTDYFSRDICDSRKNYTMCPLCDHTCDFWSITEACTYSKITYLFDNDLTIFFSLFMSIWSVVFLELWKRHSAEVTHLWGLTTFDVGYENQRVEYQTKKKKKGFISFWKKKLPNIVLSFSIVFILVLLATGAVFSVIIYRISIKSCTVVYNKFSGNGKSFSNTFVSITAGLLNLIMIFVLDIFYRYVAFHLTKLEYQRTQQDFDNSLNLKIYIFQFVNFYSSIFYVAFIKGTFIGYPAKYHRIFNYRQEECNPGGCLMELFIQLAIIMIGKQTMKNVIMILWPYILVKIKNKCRKFKIERTNNLNSMIDQQVQEDLKLHYWTSNELSNEYLDMVIQYGFVTIFVVAFPLAPFLALIHNIFEIRIQANKFLKYFRRSSAESVKDIGIWYDIINFVAALSVLSNAIIISFSSNFIPKFIYKMLKNETSPDFLDFTLSDFNVSELENFPIDSKFNVKICKYTDYRKPPWDKNKYAFTKMFWYLTTMRLLFIVIYQNLVYSLIMLIKWTIPDLPRKVKKRVNRETRFAKDYQISQM